MLITSSGGRSTGDDVADSHERYGSSHLREEETNVTVQYEKLPAMFQTVTLWRQIALSVVLNWVLGPFVRIPESVMRSMADQLDHASSRLGNFTGPTNVSRRSHHGRASQVRPSHRWVYKADFQMYSNGNDLESTSRRRRRLLRHSRHYQFNPSNHPLLPHVVILHQRHLRSEHFDITIRENGNRSPHISGYTTRRGRRYSIWDDRVIGKKEV